ncbi:hypothetical protein ACFUN7_18100 [Streptomyces sp. NPDC057236]|uniref:hypothetical protein n=1 Tax=Streptomyces sp. NPDC057236 TaxID=3346059 RepID=UPI00363504F0
MSTSARSRADLVRHSAYEFALTTVLLFAVVSLIRRLAHPGRRWRSATRGPCSPSRESRSPRSSWA